MTKVERVLSSRRHGVALYRQISRILEEEIHGSYREGQWLPPEKSLAARFEVNRHTLRRAIDELVSAGMVERRHGRGIRVLDPAINYPLHPQTRFSDNLQRLGMDDDSRLLDTDLVDADSETARLLRLGHNAQVARLQMLRIANGRPICIATAHFPCPRFRDLPLLFQGGSMHDFLNRQHHIEPRRTLSLVTAIRPQDEDASLLHLPRNHPVLQVRSVNVDPETDEPIEYVVSRFRGDSVQLEVLP